MNNLNNNLSKKDAIRLLWERGTLHWKLHDAQKKLYHAIKEYNKEITVITCARRFGKSYALCLIAIEECMKGEDRVVKYVCPTQDQVKKIIKPIVRHILKDCPPDMRPEFKTQEKLYQFPNGSQIQIAGSDGGHHEALRGGTANMWIVDEAGFCHDLKYVVNSVLAPTTDTTGGKGILSSTPSPEPDHEFITEFVEPNELSDELIKYTIYDNPMMTEDKIRKIINRYPLKEKDPEFRREYLCEVVIDTDKAVVPEFTKEIQEECVKEWPKPPFYDGYVSMDIGFDDLTVVLFGYYDFKHAVTVIEDEYYIKGPKLRSDILADAIRLKEESVFQDRVTGETLEPFLRVSDNDNLILLNDLIYNHGLVFTPTQKDNKDAALNNLRMKIANGQIIINPKCKVLIHHLKNATWDKNHKRYENSPAANIRDETTGNVIYVPKGHYDALDALVYFIRNVQENRNPYPRGYGLNYGDNMFIRPDYNKNGQYDEKYDQLVNIFRPKKSIKRS